MGVVFCAASLCAAAVGSAAPVFLPDLPDFYQHQLSGSDPSKPFDRPANFAGYANPTTPVYSNIIPLDNGGPGVQWERNGGWCYITSFTSAFYQLDKNGASGLFDHGGNYNWLERMNYAIADFAIHAWGFGEAGPQSASQFITNKIGADRISLDLFTWDVGISQVLRNSQPTAFDSMYSAYSNLLASGNSVVLNLTNPGPANPDWWWSSSYHMVAAAGYNDATSEIYFADPNNKGSDPGLADWVILTRRTIHSRSANPTTTSIRWMRQACSPVQAAWAVRRCKPCMSSALFPSPRLPDCSSSEWPSRSGP